MNLDQFHLLKEDDKEMHVKHPSGKVLVLNKAAMSDKAKHLVKKMAQGGEVANETEVKPDKGFGKIIITGLDEGGSVGKSWLDSFEDKAAQVGQKVNDTLGAGKVQQTYEKKDTTQGSVGSVKARNQIDKTYSGTSDYPNYDEGGQVEIPQNLAAPTPDTPAYAAPVAVAPEQQVQPAQAAPLDPMQQKASSTEQLLGKEETDIRDLQKAQTGAADESANAYKEYASKVGALKNPMDIQAAQEKSDAEFMKAYQEQKLDPDKYWHSLSTGSKVLAGVSLALGGIGAGLTGGKNYAHEFLSKAIDNDIEAQKNDQSKKMNLWKMNREAFGDELKATLATQNQLNTGLQAKIAAATAKAASPQAKFNGEQLINEIEQKKIVNRQRMGLLAGGGGNNAVSGTDPLLLASDPNIVPGEARQKVTDEIGKAAYATKNEEQMKTLFQQAENDNTIGGRMLRAGYEPPSMHALRLLAMPLLHDEVGRPNEHAIEAFEGILPKPGERKSTGAANIRALQQFIDMHKSAPTAKSFGINPENFKSTSSNPAKNLDAQTKQYYDFAKAHPNAQVSQDFFAKHPELK